MFYFINNTYLSKYLAVKLIKTILLLFILNAFSQTFYGQNSNTFSYTSFIANQEPKVKMLKFFPVPARDNITFEFVTGYTRGLSFEIITQIGNKMLSAPNVVSRFTLNLATYRRGVYFYVLKDKNGKSVETGKFQVIK
jgi:hypothetical protein